MENYARRKERRSVVYSRPEENPHHVTRGNLAVVERSQAPDRAADGLAQARLLFDKVFGDWHDLLTLPRLRSEAGL